jgi:hypothetical protein
MTSCQPPSVMADKESWNAKAPRNAKIVCVRIHWGRVEMDQQASADATAWPPAQSLGVSWRLGVFALLPPRSHRTILAPGDRATLRHQPTPTPNEQNVWRPIRIMAPPVPAVIARIRGVVTMECRFDVSAHGGNAPRRPHPIRKPGRSRYTPRTSHHPAICSAARRNPPGSARSRCNSAHRCQRPHASCW